MDQKLHDTYRRIENEHWWFVGRRKILFDLLKKHSAPVNSILDVGCNTGVLVRALQERGHDAYGTDLSSDAIEYGKAHGVANLQLADGVRQPFPDGMFDCVLALDVIEHIDDDGAALKEMMRVLKPNGLLIIKVPAYQFLWGVQDDVSQHKRRYTKKSLQALMSSVQLEVLRCSYFNTFLFPPIALIRLIQRIIPPKRTSDFDLNNPTVNEILKRMFLFEAQLLNQTNFPFGVSLLLVSRKT